MRFTVYGKPIGKGRPRWGNGRMYTPKDTTEYEERVAEACLKAMKEADILQIPADRPVGVFVKAYYPIPKSWSKKKQGRAVMGIETPVVKADVDNVLKILLDGMNGTIFEDDKQVIWAYVHKIYSLEPRVEISVEEVKL